jgi:hypothetical protein
MQYADEGAHSLAVRECRSEQNVLSVEDSTTSISSAFHLDLHSFRRSVTLLHGKWPAHPLIDRQQISIIFQKYRSTDRPAANFKIFEIKQLTLQF